jgi:hypothetical protein
VDKFWNSYQYLLAWAMLTSMKKVTDWIWNRQVFDLESLLERQLEELLLEQ